MFAIGSVQTPVRTINMLTSYTWRSDMYRLVLPLAVAASLAVAEQSNAQAVGADQVQNPNPVNTFGNPLTTNSGGLNSVPGRRPLNRIGIDRLLSGQPAPRGPGLSAAKSGADSDG